MTYKKTISIKFYDRIFQCSFFQETATKITIEDQPLYIAFKSDNILRWEKAFTDENGFCLMKSEKELTERLKEDQKRILYKLPTAQQLWCEMIYKIFMKSIDSVTAFNYDVKGIEVSLPDYLDESLREMILVGIDCFKKIYFIERKEKIEIVHKTNSLSFITYFKRDYSLSVSKLNEIGEQKLICFLEMGFNHSEWSIWLTYGIESILLGSGYVPIGNYVLLDHLKRMLFHSGNNKSENGFDDWTARERNKYKEWSKSLSFFLSIDSTSFKDDNDDPQQISRSDLKRSASNELNKIVEGMKQTILEVENQLKTMKVMKFNNNEINVENMKVTKYYYDTELRNWLFAELLKESFDDRSIEFIDTNGSLTLVSIGSGYVSRMLSDTMIGEQEYQNQSQQITHQEAEYTEFIQSKRFVLKRISEKKNEHGITEEIFEDVCQFPQESLLTTEVIPIGTLEKGKYMIYDNIRKFEFGRFKFVSNEPKEMYLKLRDFDSQFLVSNDKGTSIFKQKLSCKLSTEKETKPHSEPLETRKSWNKTNLILSSYHQNEEINPKNYSISKHVVTIQNKDYKSKYNEFVIQNIIAQMKEIETKNQEILAVKSMIAKQRTKDVHSQNISKMNDQIKIIEQITSCDPVKMKQRWDKCLEHYIEVNGSKSDSKTQKQTSGKKGKK